MRKLYPYNGPDHDAMTGVSFSSTRINNGSNNNQNIMKIRYIKNNFSVDGREADISYREGLGSGFIIKFDGEEKLPENELRMILQNCVCTPKEGELLKGGKKTDYIVKITGPAFKQLEKLV